MHPYVKCKKGPNLAYIKEVFIYVLKEFLKKDIFVVGS